MHHVNTADGHASVFGDAFVAEPAPQPVRSLVEYASMAISVALLVAVLWQIRSLDVMHILAMVPGFGAFWPVFVALYLVPAASEWLIYRRLWRIPGSGIFALLRKYVSNELLMGYLGEVQFYSWARAHTQMPSAPFGAIKDVTILSALVGNVITFALMLVVLPLMGTTQIGLETRTAFLSLSVVLVTSMVILLFRNRIFSLPRAELTWIGAVHLVRVIICLGLSALLWHLVLPFVPIGWWLILATLRMLISRLPLVPNKDLIFAGLAAFLLGRDIQIAQLMSMMAALILLAHLLVGAATSLADLKLKRVTR